MTQNETPTSVPDSSPILLIGGTGKTGKRIAAQLREAGHEVRPASRNAQCRFSWTDQSTWAPALAGVRAIYLVQPPFDDALVHMKPFFEQARSSGAQRLVLLSAMGAAGPLLEAEQLVKDAFPEWTMLQPTWFSQNFHEDFFGQLVRTGHVRLPVGEAEVAFIDVDDIAAVAAAALTDSRHAGRSYELTGPRKLTFTEAIGEIAQATGRDIRFTPISEEEFRAEQLAAGLSEDVVELFCYLLADLREGSHSETSDGVQQALGRQPRDFSLYVRQAAASNSFN
ncbi:NAD(P)H-binding protein [Natronoglycomyces albus]|uniref:NAD(P)H-binding protein n=1 Tax=Natronoglycomyces albus TaxID=2811108 RepID=A0A895XV98_9ACTN|nr:NAD(P)H-binding protein [Natronoglycomyces albus]QSB06150.1 NAD(P)H-binding protein [Natronoglycomyces albus]